MADLIAELLVTEAGIEKLGARGISIEEARPLPRNAHVTVATRTKTRRRADSF